MSSPDSSRYPSARDILLQHAPAAGLSGELAAFESSADLRASLEGRLLMAPMAGVSDGAYRLMARAGGAALAYSEMVSVTGLHYRSEKTWELAVPEDCEPDLAVQLFGADPNHFAEACEQVSSRLGTRLALIDVNMACPVPKVVKNGAGSALLDDTDLARDIVRACCLHTDVPVTVKIRRGRRMGEECAPQFARAMVDAGASAVAIHGRYANQMYRGEASWGVVRRVAEAVDVPVIGSGDVTDHEAALRMMEETGCSAVMVARGSYGNPWVFGDATPTTEQRIEAISCHVRLLQATGAHMARARSLVGWYVRGLPHAAAWRNAAMSCVSPSDFLTLADELRRSLREAEAPR